MSRFTADSRDRVRDAVDMIAVVSDHTELRRAGASEYVGRCPFHDERTPSFGVNPIEKVYYCFGCQASGDVFTFVMETEGLDFPGALQTLADRFGVELETEEEDPGAAARRQRRQRLQSLLGRASEYYARYLWEAREATGAREYLLGRGLREETLKEFRVGYAPSPWDRILTASRRAGFSDDELLTVGLAQRSQNRPGQIYDRFRERIMFPSTDARGNVIGFGARAMRDNQRPKYLNTAEGELYHKRRVLFGLDRARAAAARVGDRDPRRGLHRRARAPSGRARQRRRDHGHRAHRGADRRARAARQGPVAVPGLRSRRPGRDAPGRAADRPPQARAPRRPAARRHRPGRLDRARGR